jgi:hypothetical protein
LQFGALENGLRFSAELDLPTRRLIRELDGSRTLQEALAAVADVDVMRGPAFPSEYSSAASLS